MRTKQWLAAAAAWILSGVTSAAPVSFELVLAIDRVDLFSPCISDGPPSIGSQTFGCLAVGDVFRGQFSVDDAILGTDGANNTASLFSFYLPFGFAVYSTGPDNLTLAGFRNPALGAAAPGFIIENGDIVDLFGGVYGSADVPFIDMSGVAVPRNRFSAYDGTTGAQGSLSVFRVPEPGSMALVLVCAVALAATRRRRGTQASSLASGA